jgi:hypothetical protein
MLIGNKTSRETMRNRKKMKIKELGIASECLVIALRPQTPKHIRGGWSHYTDTSEPVDGGVGTLQL